MSDLATLIPKLPDARILVVGDVMLDEYVIGNVSRISPEAPVPVLEVKEHRYRAGGAANVAVNVAGLGARISLIGFTGADWAGQKLREVLASASVSADKLLAAGERPTTCKTRFIAGQQQVVRVDRESRLPLEEPLSGELIALTEKALEDVDLCILSDYAKGLLSEHICLQIIGAARKRRVSVVVDPKGSDFAKYRGCSVITPNLHETAAAAGMPVDSDAGLRRAAERILDVLPGTALLVTRGADGMTLFRESHEPLTIPTVTRKVFDVVGAGDTAVATLSASLAAGASLEHAIELANTAAGVAVERHGTVAVGLNDLSERVRSLSLAAASVG